MNLLRFSPCGLALLRPRPLLHHRQRRRTCRPMASSSLRNNLPFPSHLPCSCRTRMTTHPLARASCLDCKQHPHALAGILALPAATATRDIQSMQPVMVSAGRDVQATQPAHCVSLLQQLFPTGNASLPHGVSLDNQGRIYVACAPRAAIRQLPSTARRSFFIF